MLCFFSLLLCFNVLSIVCMTSMSLSHFSSHPMDVEHLHTGKMTDSVDFDSINERRRRRRRRTTIIRSHSNSNSTRDGFLFAILSLYNTGLCCQLKRGRRRKEEKKRKTRQRFVLVYSFISFIQCVHVYHRREKKKERKNAPNSVYKEKTNEMVVREEIFIFHAQNIGFTVRQRESCVGNEKINSCLWCEFRAC